MHPRDRAATRTTRAARRCRRCPRGYSLRAMPAIVVPFRGAEGKSRLHESRRMRRTLALAMLGDVLAACSAVGETTVVTADGEARGLAADLDTIDDLQRVGLRAGPRTQAALAELSAEVRS